MDLNTLTLKELKKLRKDVDKTIADFEGRKKREALA
jgi:DNA-binding protein H-NS